MSRPTRDFVGATRGKLALAAVLAVVLAWVLASNFRGAAADEAEPPGRAAASAPPTRAAGVGGPGATAAKASPSAELAAADDWPDVDLDRLIQFDPLKKPDALAAPAATVAETARATEQAIQDLQNATGAIIFVSGGERVAHIGSQQYRVGDMVGEYLITDISSAGIVLSPPESDARTTE